MPKTLNCEVKTKWTCPDCGHSITNWTMKHVADRGTPYCPKRCYCGHGASEACGCEMRLDPTY